MTHQQPAQNPLLMNLLTYVRSIRRALSLRLFRERIVEYPFLNSSLKVVIADPVAESWYGHHLPTASEMHFLRDYGLKPGARVFDIGAHQAVIAAMLTRIVAPNGTPKGAVVALEPDPFSYQIALRNKALNGLDALEVVQAAGSDHTHTVEFGLAVGTSGFIASKSDGVRTIQVPAYSVDDLADKYGVPDVLYIDVEGFEQHVLTGAKRTLATAHPDCVVEVHLGVGLERAGGSVAGILACFPPDVYDFYIKHPDPARREELIALSEVGVEKWTYHCNMVAVKRKPV